MSKLREFASKSILIDLFEAIVTFDLQPIAAVLTHKFEKPLNDKEDNGDILTSTCYRQSGICKVNRGFSSSLRGSGLLHAGLKFAILTIHLAHPSSHLPSTGLQRKSHHGYSLPLIETWTELIQSVVTSDLS